MTIFQKIQTNGLKLKKPRHCHEYKPIDRNRKNIDIDPDYLNTLVNKRITEGTDKAPIPMPMEELRKASGRTVI